MTQHQNGNRRLDSWKEIASHLGRNERTAIRWEKKGLPVHRVPGGQRQAVFAYTAEIDAWLISQETDQDELGSAIEAPPNSEVAPPENSAPESSISASPTTSPNRASQFRKWIWLAVALCLGGLGWTAFSFIPTHTHVPAPSIRFAQLTGDGRFKLDIRTGGRNLYINEIEGGHPKLFALPATGGEARPIATPFANVLLQDVSRDGKNLLLASFEGMEFEKPLWVMPTEGGSARRVGDVLCQVARWSPDDSRIACTSRNSIILVQADGSDAHAIASFPSIPSNLLWSPDGSRLQFSLKDTATHSFSSWQMSIPKQYSPVKPLLKLMEGKDVCWDWTWTHDGQSFVCLRSDAEGKTRLAMERSVDVLSTWPVFKTELPLNLQTVVGLAPGYSENSLYILVADHYRAELLKFDTRQGVFETFLNGLSADYLSFSRDGRWVTYVNTADRSLWRSRADGSSALQLTKPPLEIEMSSWSPDGRQIAYMGRQPGKPWRVFLVARDGGSSKEVSDGNDNQGAPTWSPDGQSLIYANVDCDEMQTCRVRRVNIATREVNSLPNSNGLRTARWSPDGSCIAALRPTTHELVLFDLKTQRWTTIADSITGDNINWSSDSQSLYVDSPHAEKPVIERIRISSHQRSTVTTLTSLHNAFGQVSSWMGIAPDNSPIVVLAFANSEVYSVEWVDH